MAVNIKAATNARADRRAQIIAQMDADLKEIDALREQIKMYAARTQVTAAATQDKLARLDVLVADLERTH